jgi:alkanesulfonate monooxygenase SsuD/methylene tetrahydromethanopterin reductase-like flavin-dependent oxidoreductase (luciferase family)
LCWTSGRRACEHAINNQYTEEVPVQFGIQFFPDVGPTEKSAQDYFHDALAIAEEADRLGYVHVRTVEHYFTPYGGYSPNPLIFLTAIAMRTKRARIITGALLPVFNNPLKLAGEIGMVDAISGGRLDCGFARAFLPHEFHRFGISPDESIARYREGLEQIEQLLTQENVSSEGKFHSFPPTTSLPRPTQQPRPKFFVASIASPDSFAFAGTKGYSVMAIPLTGAKMKELIAVYRQAWKEAGHPGQGEVLVAYHMVCHEDGDTARAIARDRLQAYLDSLVTAASGWVEGVSSKDYPGYDKVIAGLKTTTMDSLIASNAAWIGSPAEVRDGIARAQQDSGGFELASLQVNFHTMKLDQALASIRLFADKVMPHFAEPSSRAVA